MRMLLLIVAIAVGKYYTEANFSAVVTAPIIVRFCDSYGSYCSNLRSDFIQAIATIKCDYAEINCSKNNEYCSLYSISTMPSIAVISPNGISHYYGDDDTKSIYYGINSILAINFQKYDHQIPKITIGSKSEEDVYSGIEIEEAVIQHEIAKNSFVLYNFKGYTAKYDNPTATEASIREFILMQFAKDKPVSYRRKMEELMINYNHTFILLFSAAKDNARHAFWNASNLYSTEEIIFTSAENHSQSTEKIMALFSITNKDLPLVVIAHNSKTGFKTFRMNASITEANINHFITEWKQGKAKRFLRSEPIPQPSSDIITKVVGDSFEKEVLECKKTVVVKYYNAYCKHCIVFKPVFEEVAKKWAGTVKFVEIDLIKNDVDGVFGVPYPSVYIYKENEKGKPIVYNGERKYSEFDEFLAKTLSISQKDSL